MASFPPQGKPGRIYYIVICCVEGRKKKRSKKVTRLRITDFWSVSDLLYSNQVQITKVPQQVLTCVTVLREVWLGGACFCHSTPLVVPSFNLIGINRLRSGFGDIGDLEDTELSLSTDTILIGLTI